jgi:ketosteroid isomerase-like protein
VRRALPIALSLLAGCPAPKSTPAAPKPSAELSPVLAPYAWWLGDWRLDRVEANGAAGDTGGATEHWVAAGGAIYGVGLTAGDFFEVLVVDDADGPGPVAADRRPRLWAMPNGAKSVRFAGGDARDGTAAFANPEHDFPKSITYRVAGTGLAAELEGVEDGVVQRQRYTFTRTAGDAAPALEAADRAFAADVAARGVAGWVAAFEPKGGMISRGARVEGPEAIGELMRGVLAGGVLAWTPIASRVRGKIGFTVGKATFTGATPAAGWKSTYVTIWRRQLDGGWKVLFDTGRLVNE